MIPWSHRSINGFRVCLVKAVLPSGVKVGRSTNGHQPTMARWILQGRAADQRAKQTHIKDLIEARGRKGGASIWLRYAHSTSSSLGHDAGGQRGWTHLESRAALRI